MRLRRNDAAATHTPRHAPSNSSSRRNPTGPRQRYGIFPVSFPSRRSASKAIRPFAQLYRFQAACSSNSVNDRAQRNREYNSRKITRSGLRFLRVVDPLFQSSIAKRVNVIPKVSTRETSFRVTLLSETMAISVGVHRFSSILRFLLRPISHGGQPVN